MRSYPIYGASDIDAKAIDQMNAAMQLPITVAGALMPDAHTGYGLPIGGVLATDPQTIIPYAVGVDIACRMCLSVFDMPPAAIADHHDELLSSLRRNTHFGLGAKTRHHLDTTLFDRPEWSATSLLRSLKDKAHAQLGTSGTGNHFVEWGVLTLKDGALPSVPAGDYVALLSHSGSRGLGGTIASHYSKIAMLHADLPEEVRRLAWLDLATEEGQEYWLSMNLAGDYASANHHEIHAKIARSMELQPMAMVENHHNFAWRERLDDGSEVMVHRKGATPAGEGVLGVIPGSMTAPGFIVRGKGSATSINSASHGAGRSMSRTAAHKTVDRAAWRQALEASNITLVGSDVDEAPEVYKDIHRVMEAQTDLVEIVGRFEPRIVRMADAKERPDD
jgi:tRNA-splicing ligase RtcB (3'-phosphate/5'-hydroxy nucleic acid ligase)